MNKPTVRDISRAAGVSHGTVSNVLNGKGNVSIKKIQKVEEVARKLGYKINYTAKTLRSGATNSISIILPSVEPEEYAQLYQGLDKTLTKLGYRTHLYTTEDVQQNERDILKEIAEARVTGVVTITCLDDASDYYRELNIENKNIIFVNRKVRNCERFISFDFPQAGKEIKKYIATKKYEKIGIFSDQIKFSNEKLFVDAIVVGLQDKQVKHVDSTFNQSYSKAFEFFGDESFDIIICSDLSKANKLKKANYWGAKYKFPQVLCLASTPSDLDEKVIKFQQNYHLLGSRTADLLIKQVTNDKEMDNVIIFENKGILTYNDFRMVDSQKSLDILTVQSPTTDAINKLLPHFEKRTGIKVNLVVKPYNEIYQILSNEFEHNQYDIIRMDMAWFPWFGKKIYQPLNNLDDKLDELLNAYPAHLKDNYADIGGTSYGLPLDPSVQMLFYRKDLFEDQKIKRLYYESRKKQLKLPENFDEFNELLQFFSDPYFKNSKLKYGTSTILGRPEIIATEFLIRYYAENGTLINSQGEVKLNNKKAIKALNNYIKMVSLSQQLDEAWWGESVNSFAKGETAMILGFMNHVSRIAHSDIGTLIGFTSVPGEKPLLGGGVIGITAQTHNKKASIDFLNWVNETETAEQITLLGGTTVNQNLRDNYTINTFYPWLHGAMKSSFNGIRETKFKEGEGLNSRNIEQIIGNAVKGILYNHKNPESSIKKLNQLLATSRKRMFS